MYTGQDLLDLQTALVDLTSDNFFQYEFYLGKANPYLNIRISDAWMASYPALDALSYIRGHLAVYSTTDFSIPVADFITAMQDACHAYATAQMPFFQAYFNHALDFQDFLDILVTKE